MKNIKLNQQLLIAGLLFAFAAYLGLTGYFSTNMGTDPLNELFFTILTLTPAILFLTSSLEKRK